MTITTSAPGKLMLMGEYAVLFGAQAVVAAIDRMAHCTYDDAKPLSVNSSLAESSDFFDSPLFSAVTRACSAHGLLHKVGAYTVDTSAFYQNMQKIGFGSSAAATVALTEVILKQHAINHRDQLFSIACEAHRELNSKMGSGADVAASVYGGVIGYQKTSTQGSVVPLSDALFSELLVVNTKLSQKTAPMVARVLELAHKNRRYTDEFCRESHDLTSAFIHAPNLSTRISIFEQAATLLDLLGQKAQINIMSAPHQIIAKLARSLGGAAKPSGAGGGDLSLALIPESNRASFIEQTLLSGFEILNLSIKRNDFFGKDYEHSNT